MCGRAAQRPHVTYQLVCLGTESIRQSWNGSQPRPTCFHSLSSTSCTRLPKQEARLEVILSIWIRNEADATAKVFFSGLNTGGSCRCQCLRSWSSNVLLLRASKISASLHLPGSSAEPAEKGCREHGQLSTGRKAGNTPSLRQRLVCLLLLHTLQCSTFESSAFDN